MAQHSRDELLYLARLAEQCDRFDGKSFFPWSNFYLQKWSATFNNSRRQETRSLLSTKGTFYQSLSKMWLELGEQPGESLHSSRERKTRRAPLRMLRRPRIINRWLKKSLLRFAKTFWIFWMTTSSLRASHRRVKFSSRKWRETITGISQNTLQESRKDSLPNKPWILTRLPIP